jgi:hypothetical protein
MVSKAITRVQLTLKEYIRDKKELEVSIFTRLFSHLVNTWTEIRVLKLIYENGAFTDSEKTELVETDVAEKRWMKALTIAFCKAYSIVPVNENKIDINSAEGKKFKILKDVISKDLLLSIEVRNRIAHGQWKFTFNGKLTALNNDIQKRLDQENIVTLQLKYETFQNLAKMIHDLAVSRLTFERDFTKYLRRLEGQRKNIYNRSYLEFKKMLVEEGKQGKERMKKNYASQL